MTRTRQMLLAAGLAIASTVSISSANLTSASPSGVGQLNRDSDQALLRLYETHPSVETLSRNAKAILVFPNVVKAGFVFGGACGEGELKQGSRIDGYYNSVTSSWGFQAGIQSYGYVVFLMTNRAVN
jgi:lipid-binding SYLF domain-containing protein